MICKTPEVVLACPACGWQYVPWTHLEHDATPTHEQPFVTVPAGQPAPDGSVRTYPVLSDAHDFLFGRETREYRPCPGSDFHPNRAE